MIYTVKFERENNFSFCFEDGECCPENIYEDEPSLINGYISSNDEKIGYIRLYELYNDRDFFDKCDAISGDCGVIAGVICSKNGNILKKYLPDEAEYETILILDQISINKDYRGMGIGSDVIKNLLYMIKYQFDSGCAIFLCASDYESASKYGFDSKEYRDGCNRLIVFYKKLGFKVIKDNVLVYVEE